MVARLLANVKGGRDVSLDTEGQMWYHFWLLYFDFNSALYGAVLR